MSFLSLKGVTKQFGGLTAVRNVSMEVAKGEIIGLIGPNGAGKTTLFNLITGYYAPTQGSIQFGGREIAGLDPSVVCRRGIGRTFQITKPLPNLTVLDNVVVGALLHTNSVREAREHATEVLQFLNLWHRKDYLGKSLPIGELKRLEICKALATRPEMLLLDEVAAGLTPREGLELIEMVQRINARGVTVVLVEHVMKVVMSLSHRVVVLHHGEKVAEGTPQEIVTNPKVIEAYLGESYAAG